MATWNTDNPKLANAISADVPDCEENFQELHDVITAITNGTLGTTTAADFRVDAGGLASNAVETAKIKDANVTAAKLAANAVETAKIKDANVTAAKLGADCVDGTKIGDDSINSEHYVDGSIDPAHIASNAVTTVKILDANVTAAKLAAGVIPSFGSYIAKNYAQEYQAAEDGFVVGEVYADDANDCGDIDGSEGAGSGNLTKRVTASAYHCGSADCLANHNSFCMPVKKDNYWRAYSRNRAGACVFTLYWMPAG